MAPTPHAIIASSHRPSVPEARPRRPHLGGSLTALMANIVARPGFRRWAAAFPLTRPLARRRAQALFDLCAGFVYAQVLYACVELDLFRMLAEGPQTVAAVARRANLPAEGAARLLAAAVSLRLAARDGDRFRLGALGAAMVGNDALNAMVAHHRIFYADMQDPVALLRRGGTGSGLAGYWPYAACGTPGQLKAAAVAPYTALMAASQPMIADEVLDAYDMGKHRCLLDVGGGDGGFALAAASRNPNLQAMVFDLPSVAAQADHRIARAGLAARIRAIGGDFHQDALPRGADLVSLVRVIHDHDDDAALRILRAAHHALPPGGTLLLAEPMAGTGSAATVGDAYFGFYLLAMGSGRARTAESLQAMLAEAGFSLSPQRRTAMPMLTRLLVARKL
jgi:demethylspheroidene O-methyltransferase